MGRITRKIIDRRAVVLIASIVLLAFGIYSYYVMPKQEMPDIKTPYGFVEIIAPGYNAEEMKKYVADDVEEIVKKYSTVNHYSTTCLDNAMVMFIDMNINTTEYVEQFKDIENEINDSTLDERISEIKISINASVPEVIYAVHSNTLSELQLEDIAKDLSKELSAVDNVQNTVVDSAYKKEVVVEIDYDELNDLPLTVKDVYSILYVSGVEVPLGNLKIGQKDSSIILDTKYDDIEDIEDIVIFGDPTTGNIITIEDIATVALKDTDDKKNYEYNGETSAFVEMHFAENIDFTKVDSDIKGVISKYEEEIDEDVTITSVIFSPEHVKNQVNQVMINLLQCIGIVMLVVLIGLGVRNSIVIVFTIPVIVMSTIGMLYVLKSDLQLMSIAGLIISIGILVDNSIVISDATQHFLDTGANKKDACVAAVKENWLPVFTSTLTTVAAFAPLLTLPGTAGDVAFTLPLTLLIAISISFLAAVTLTPALASWLFKPHKARKNKKIHEYKQMTKVMKVFLKLSVLPTVVAFILLAGLGYSVITTQEIDIFPKTEKSIVYIDYEYEILNDNEGAYDYAKQIEDIVKQQDDVLHFGFSQGGDLPQFNQILEPVTSLPQYGRFIIEYDCVASRLDSYMQELDDDLNPLKEHGEITIKRLELSAPIAPVQVILVCNDFTYLQQVSMEVFEKVNNLESFKSGELKLADTKTDIVLDIDKEDLALYSLTLAEVQEQVTIAINGITDDLYTNNGTATPTKTLTNIETPDDLMELNIVNTSGESVELGDIADYDERNNLEYISYYNGIPSVTIDAYTASGYSTYDLEKNIKEVIENTANENVTTIFKGDNQTTNEVIGGMTVALIIALIAIYFIMYFQFDSFIQPMIIFISIPLSFIGSLAAMLVLNQKITLTGLLGLVSLVGIVVNNGILLVENINRLRKTGKNVHDSCILAANRRLRPILLSSLTTILGLIPLAIFGGDFFRPMAVIFMGGLVVSTMLVIFMVPNLYYFFYKKYDLRDTEKSEIVQ